MTTFDGQPPHINATPQNGSEGLLFDYVGVLPTTKERKKERKEKKRKRESDCETQESCSNRQHKVFVVKFHKKPPVRKRTVDFGVVPIRCV